jgi:hypothetical protein
MEHRARVSERLTSGDDNLFLPPAITSESDALVILCAGIAVSGDAVVEDFPDPGNDRLVTGRTLEVMVIRIQTH